jgi:transposase
VVDVPPKLSAWVRVLSSFADNARKNDELDALATRIIGTVGNVARFPTKAYFASYSGTVPVEVSSGEAVRHRLSLAGNRKLSYALHMVAVCQARSDARGGIYYRKRIAEGKSRKEALRCLKRRVSDAVFKSLMADLHAPSRSAA